MLALYLSPLLFPTTKALTPSDSATHNMANHVKHWQDIVSLNMSVLGAVVMHDTTAFAATSPLVLAGTDYQRRLSDLDAGASNFLLISEITTWRVAVASFAQRHLGTRLQRAVEHFIQQDPAWVVPAGATPFASLPPGTCLAVLYN